MPTYRPFADLDQEFALAPATLDNAETVRRLMVQATCVEPHQKADMCRLMKWDPSNVTNDLAEPDYFRALARVLFVGAPPEDRGDVLPRIVSQALADFFG